MVYTDILLVGVEVADVLERDQSQLVVNTGADMVAPAFDSRFTGELGQHRATQPLRMREGACKTFAPDGFQHVSDSARIERIDRVLIVRRCKHDSRWPFHRIQVVGGLNPIEARHANVQQDNIGLLSRRDFKGIFAITRFANDFVFAEVIHELAQTIARRLFIVDDQNPHSWLSWGNRSLTAYADSLAATSTVARLP